MKFGNIKLQTIPSSTVFELYKSDNRNENGSGFRKLEVFFQPAVNLAPIISDLKNSKGIK